ncbi:MAG: hypothetical protein KA028_01635 [Candidatus Pacebacteria bacterium]|nr:hypothetical protein [Candidatus Paceibacterota bacterium]
MRKSRKQKIAMQNQQQNAQGNANTAQPVAPAPNNAVAQANGTVIVLLTYLVLIIGGIVIWNLWPSSNAQDEQLAEMTNQQCVDGLPFTFDSKTEMRYVDIRHKPKKGKLRLKNYHYSITGGCLAGTDRYNNPINFCEGESGWWSDKNEEMILHITSGDIVTINICYYEKPF